MAHSKEYRNYLKSPTWQTKRQQAITQAGFQCQRCGRRRHECILQVHHQTYERLGNEHPNDLKVVCLECHKVEDNERRHRVQNEIEARRYDARVRAWAKKVYGDDWEIYKDEDEVSDAFDDWLDRRGGW